VVIIKVKILNAVSPLE